MHTKQVIKAGTQTGEATKALVMLHGRGGSAEDILGLAQYLPVNDFALFAPQATNNTWYPYSFMAAPQENEPWLSGALKVVGEVVADIEAGGIKKENIYFLGFSQGACLTLEYVARNAGKYGGVVAFTGGLIGDQLYLQNYKGDFAGTPVFIGTSDPDPHVPVHRVLASTAILTDMHAQVTQKIYKNMGHTISQDEINQVSELIFKES
ncbi:phospholipase [Niastella koreensis]|uniref:Phospholipase/Carboxylesterase n=2 Tax=Niastella koreensis TaxID=354356 RepID=G8TCV6_NIAKG|nr:dienelactone hydrolase family protein [Niastella koreensis]AEV97165.1 phospholipase/Carboxylesterase [Niastella koreensis GR20-10]OQP39153.1 phospholipase [Niastella koreensis]